MVGEHRDLLVVLIAPVTVLKAIYRIDSEEARNWWCNH